MSTATTFAPERARARTTARPGAASGIGRQIALALSGAGVVTVIADRHGDGLELTAADIRSGGGECHPFVFDLADDQMIRQFARLWTPRLDRVGHIDILVNAAGISDGVIPLLQVDRGTWERVFSVNLWAPMLLMQLIGRLMVDRHQGGKIVNVSSSSAFRAKQTSPAYAAAKSALNQLTRTGAAELGAHDINVNAVAPGITDTPIIQNLGRDFLKDAALGNLLGRVSMPEDVASVVLFLCHSGSRQITGQVIHTSAGAIV